MEIARNIYGFNCFPSLTFGGLAYDSADLHFGCQPNNVHTNHFLLQQCNRVVNV